MTRGAKQTRSATAVIRPCAIIPLLSLLAFAAAPAQDRPAAVRLLLVRGRVLSAAKAISGAAVTVHDAAANIEVMAVTSDDGVYQVRMRTSAARLIVSAAASGYRSRSVEIVVQGDSAAIVNLALERAITTLPSVRVRASRPTPDRNPGSGILPGGSERFVDGLSGAIAPLDQGSLNAGLAAIPGVLLTASGPSVLGLPAEQNRVSLNGMSLDALEIPRDANARVRVATSPYDPARGGFSGAEIALELPRGGRYNAVRSHVTIEPVGFGTMAADRGSRGPATVQASIGSNGEWRDGRFNYNGAAQITHRAFGTPSVFHANSAVLQDVGVSPDSIGHFVQALSIAGVPVAGDGGEGLTSVSMLGRLDLNPNAPSAWSLTGYGKASRAGGVWRTPFSTPSVEGQRSQAIAQVQLFNSTIAPWKALIETRTALTVSADQSHPVSQLPAGSVRIESDGGGASSAGSTLMFGGGIQPAVDVRTWTSETLSEGQWFSTNNRHRFKLSADIRLDGTSRAEARGTFGVVRYGSLANLENAQPDLYELVTGTREGSASSISSFVAFSDNWRPTPRLSLLYGLRVEADRASSPFALDSAARHAFSELNAGPKSYIHASPRIGFTWNYGSTGVFETGERRGTLGTWFFGPRRGVLRGGIGEFRGVLPTSALAAWSLTTSNSPSVLRCIGAAVPVIDWQLLRTGAEAPSACEGSASESSLSERVEHLELASRSLRAPTSVRANLAWTRTVGPITTTLEGAYSINRNQPGFIDANFAGRPYFRLHDEADRPVFLDPSAIDPASGLATYTSARLVPEYGRVLVHRSDLRSIGQRLTMVVAPANPELDRFYWTVAYTLGRARRRARGFDTDVSAFPSENEWAPSALDLRHQVQIQLGHALGGVAQFSVSGQLNSGFPYTPLVDADINGDGLTNDRAFIFDPERGAGIDIRAQMKELLAHASRSARSCLMRQLGRAAASNSCRGPWSATMNLSIDLLKGVPRATEGGRLSIGISNPLAAIDRLMHGQESLRGWGAVAIPDPVLLHVDGFDPVAQRFVYRANPNFGSTRSSRIVASSPFRLTIDASIPLGPSIWRQQLDRLLRPGRAGRPGARATADEIRRRYDQTAPDIYETLDEESDNLFLTVEQRDALRAAHIIHRRRVSAIWTSLAEYLASLGDRYDADAALRKADQATTNVWAEIRAQRSTIVAILTPDQWTAMPASLRTALAPGVGPASRVFIR